MRRGDEEGRGREERGIDERGTYFGGLDESPEGHKGIE